MLRIHCQEPWFSKIKYGHKTVEGRKFSAKYANCVPGDEVNFYCGSDSFNAQIVKVVRYNNLADYLQAEGFDNVLPGVTSFDDAIKVYLQYNTQEELEKADGFLAIHLTVIGEGDHE